MIICYTTTSTLEEAKELAHKVLLEKLAICANFFPKGSSLYIWNDGIEESEECYILFKTSKSLSGTLQKFIEAHHPYDLPAIISLDASSNSSFNDYLEKILHKNMLEDSKE